MFLPEFDVCKTLIIVLVNFTIKVTDNLKFLLVLFFYLLDILVEEV